MATPSKKTKEIEGFHYHERTKALHLRLEKHSVLLETLTLLQHGHFQAFRIESLHLSIGESLLDPNQLHSSIHALHFQNLCQTLRESLTDLKEIHVGRALSGFVFSNTGAWCPVEALQVLAQEKPTPNHQPLEIFMLRNLQVYSTREQIPPVEDDEGVSANNENASTTEPICAVHLLAHSLKEHSSLWRFGLVHCEFVDEESSPSLDPLLQSLSTIPQLHDIVVQSPPWYNMVQVYPQVLETLVGSSTQGLCLDGFCLEGKHIQSLLLQSQQQQKSGSNQYASLQNLSLALVLTIDNVQSVADSIAQVLQTLPLRQVCLRLEWKTDLMATTANAAAAMSNAATKRLRQRRIHGLQSFQDTLASALLHRPLLSSQPQGSCHNPSQYLQRLDIIYYDSCHRWDTNPPVISPRSFQQVLECHYNLTHLRLPYCVEMDPRIDFLLKLNRTGLRQRLLFSSNDLAACDAIHGLMQIQQDHPTPNKICWNSSQTSTLPLSMMYYLLLEMPRMFLKQ